MGPCVPGDLHCNSNDSHRYQVSLSNDSYLSVHRQVMMHTGAESLELIAEQEKSEGSQEQL